MQMFALNQQQDHSSTLSHANAFLLSIAVWLSAQQIQACLVCGRDGTHLACRHHPLLCVPMVPFAPATQERVAKQLVAGEGPLL